MNAIGRVFEVREFCLHDGPGPRTTVFLQGCPLRCTWCQNPEGQAFDGGKPRSAPDLAAEIATTADFLAASGGGVTFSGGEPLAQADFICAVIDCLNGMSGLAGKLTYAIETSGYAAPEAYRKVVRKLDLVLQDIKFGDLEGYRTWTKVNAELIFRNLEWLKSSGIPFVARIPTMPGVNDLAEVKEGIARLLQDAPNLQRIELLPYNVLAGSKYAKLGRPYEPGFDERQKPDLSTGVFAAHGLNAVSL